MPDIPSSFECVNLAARLRLCADTANLCASSRICINSFSAIDVRGSIITSPAPFLVVTICSNFFARPISGISRSNSFNEPLAALTCPAPPSINIRSGIAACSFRRRAYLRRTTSSIIAKSSIPFTVLMLNCLYSLLDGIPFSNTTIEPTASVPDMFEMSNASMRPGGKSNESASFN